MKFLLFFTFLLAYVSGKGQLIQYIPAAPYPVEVPQPDGSVIKLQGMGDEFNHFPVTEDGFTVMKNERGVYEFARLDEDGKLSPSGYRARNLEERTVSEKQFLTGISKYQKATFPKAFLKSATAEDGLQKAFPSSGTRKILMLLIEYSDLENTYSTTQFNNLMNQSNYYGVGSFRDYFLEASVGELSLSVDVFGWYAAKNSYDYYGDDNGDDRARELVAEAIDAAEAAGVDFSQYDNDNDGEVDNLMVVHSGPGAEEGSQTEYIWSHSWSLGFQYDRTYDGVDINDYIIQPETRVYGMVGIGVFCHEFGHALGLPDLYDTDDSNGDSEGLGNWCLMASGSWSNSEKTPAMPSAWVREELGWINPTVISAEGDYSLSPTAVSTDCYKLLTPNGNEYFLLENRYKTGFDASLPGSGLAVFHINTNKSDNEDEVSKLSDLEEADGQNHLDNSVNRGDAGDLFPGTSGNTAFNDLTYPNAKTYTQEFTSIDIQSIQLSGSVINFTLGPGVETGIDLTFKPVSNVLSVNLSVIDVGVMVQNSGSLNAGSFSVAFYLSTDATVTTADYLLGAETVFSLDAGESESFHFTRNVAEVTPEIPDGNYYVGYIIDDENAAEELNENNNSYLFSSPRVKVVSLPNLTNVDTENRLEIVASKINIGLYAVNQGGGPSESTRVGFYISTDDNITTSDYLVQYTSLQTLNVGESVYKSASIDIAALEGKIPEGSYFVGYIIDYQNKVAELVETDNDFCFYELFHYCTPKITEIKEVICQGESFVYRDGEYFDEGIYEFKYESSRGCDSVLILNLTVSPVVLTELNEVICRGESFIVGQTEYSNPGSYSQVLSTHLGCDSIVVLNLEVADPVEEIISQSICEGDSIQVAGVFYSDTGTYFHTLTGQWGCDSVVTLNLSVFPHSDTLIAKTICEGDSFLVGTSVYSHTGIYTETLINQFGCDSTVYLNLTVNPVDTTEISENICEGSGYPFGGTVFTSNGVYEHVFSNRFGCDSLVTLHLSVTPLPVVDLGDDFVMFSSETVILDAGAGFSYWWNSGETTQTISVSKERGLGLKSYEVNVINEIGCSATDKISVTVYDDSAVENQPGLNFTLFPNPSGGVVKLLMKQIVGNYRVQVVGANGNVVYQNEFESPGEKFVRELNLTHLHTGHYSVRIIAGDHIVAEKLIIVRY